MIRRVISSIQRLKPCHYSQTYHQATRHLSLTPLRCDLMEFFDDKKNWGESQIRVGRSWRIDELRLKSNVDLHKLWYILLKERNMLYTMEYEANRDYQVFPNPERIDKVQESMDNLEKVVRERNRAYYELETGVTGERPGAEYENFLGLQEYVEHKEYHIPKELNKTYLEEKAKEPQSSEKEKRWFLSRWRVKQRKMEQMALRRKQYEVLNILREFPDCDKEALREKYPEVNVDKYIDRMKQRHYDNMIGWDNFEISSLAKKM